MNQAFYIHIIESPSSENLFADKREGAVLGAGLKLLGLKSEYYLVVDKERFLKALRMASENIGGGHIPTIIHLSSHGNSSGITLTDDSFINWTELKGLLAPINKGLKGALLLCISSCEGFQGFKMAWCLPGELPFFGMVGPTAKLSWQESSIGFLSFYHNVFHKGVNIPEAVRIMGVASGNPCFKEVLASTVQQGWLSSLIALAAKITEKK
jgi:hypothetical protein